MAERVACRAEDIGTSVQLGGRFIVPTLAHSAEQIVQHGRGVGVGQRGSRRDAGETDNIVQAVVHLDGAGKAGQPSGLQRLGPFAEAVADFAFAFAEIFIAVLDRENETLKSAIASTVSASSCSLISIKPAAAVGFFAFGRANARQMQR